LAETDKISDRYRQLLREQEAQARQSYRLATIVTNLKLPISLRALKVTGFDSEKVYAVFKKFEFRSLLNKIPTKLAKGIKTKDENEYSRLGDGQKKSADYQLVNNDHDFTAFLAELNKQKFFALDTETTSLEPLDARLLGISFCWQTGRAFYLNIADHPHWLKKLQSILADPNIKKIGHNLKYDYKIIKLSGGEVNGLYFDTLLAGYLLLPPTHSLKLDDLAFSQFGYKMQAIEELIGPKGKNQLNMADVSPEKISFYSGEDADYTWRLYKKFSEQIIAADMSDSSPKLKCR
jgi:DNA polymerase-1